jgi:hypothetical protein
MAVGCLIRMGRRLRGLPAAQRQLPGSFLSSDLEPSGLCGRLRRLYDMAAPASATSRRSPTPRPHGPKSRAERLWIPECCEVRLKRIKMLTSVKRIRRVLDPLADPLAGPAGRAPVDSATTPVGVAGHVRGDLQVPASLDEPGCA